MPFNTFFSCEISHGSFASQVSIEVGKKATRPSPIHFLTDSQKIYYCTHKTLWENGHVPSFVKCAGKSWTKVQREDVAVDKSKLCTFQRGGEKIRFPTNFLIICLIYHSNHCHAYERQNIIRTSQVAEIMDPEPNLKHTNTYFLFSLLLSRARCRNMNVGENLTIWFRHFSWVERP